MADQMKGGYTPRQKKVVDNLLSGKFKTQKDALKDAGYAMKDVDTVGTWFLRESKGVKNYLLELGKKVQEMYGIPIDTKIVEVLADGLRATKPYGKNAILHADFKERREYTKDIMKLFGIIIDPKNPGGPGGVNAGGGNSYTQVNFFGAPKEERNEFNEDFKSFIKAKSSIKK